MFHFNEGLEPNAGRKNASAGVGQVDGRRDAERFAGITDHRLLDRAVVLNPVEPWRIPDSGKMDWSRGADIIVVIPQIDGEHLIADSVQCVEARIPLGDALRSYLILQVGDV